MHIVYYDESGDDGFPQYSSPLFVLTAVYMNHQVWKENFDAIRKLRRELSANHKLPVKMEMHTRQFLFNKNPYRNFSLSDAQRVQIIDEICDAVAKLEIEIVNVCINKPVIISQNYKVLDTALTYSVQRIENTLESEDATNKFLIITDEGRLGKMRATTRAIQRINYIPPRGGGNGTNQPIKCLIEDPLPKNSTESYFIQISDMVAYLVYCHMLERLNAGQLGNRMPSIVDFAKIEDWLTRLKPVINMLANPSDRKFGIVCYPK